MQLFLLQHLLLSSWKRLTAWESKKSLTSSVQQHQLICCSCHLSSSSLLFFCKKSASIFLVPIAELLPLSFFPLLIVSHTSLYCRNNPSLEYRNYIQMSRSESNFVSLQNKQSPKPTYIRKCNTIQFWHIISVY